MVDSVQIFKPGFRVVDGAGVPVPGAVILIFEAGTETPREVFSDFGLATSLGVTVTCDAGGYPTSNGNAKVEIYTGASPFKITLKDADGVTVFSHDNVIGALDTSVFLLDGDVTPSTPIDNTSSDQTPTAADGGTFFNVDCSGGDKSATIDNAADCGDGWSIKVRHDGTANQVLITGTSADLFKIGGRAGVTGFALTRIGQTVAITCDGVGFMVEETCSGLFNTTGVILIADVLSTPPGSPQAGQRYILGAAPTGAWSTFAQHDIAEYSGSGWFKITPPSDCGWVAYVQNGDTYRAFKSSTWTGLGKALLQVFTGSGTYTPTPGMASCRVISTGGGGGGGGAASTDASAKVAAGGGAGGGTCVEMFSAADIGASQTVTIGAGGTAGANTGGNGGAGGDTTFGALHTATGGGPGKGLNALSANSDEEGGAGGIPTGGAINIVGGDGRGGVCASASIYGGDGGGSYWGGGPKGARKLNSGDGEAGRAGTAYGTGGSGAASIDQNSATGVAGGVGAGGVVEILEFF